MQIGLGTAQFGMSYGITNSNGTPSIKEVESILNLARESGIDTLDTAIAYGGSEACLGRIGVKDFRLITKLPHIPNGIPSVKKWVSDQIHESLVRLGVCKLYGLLFHNASDLLGSFATELLDSLLELQGGGIIERVGISAYYPHEIIQIRKTIPLQLVQVPLNIFDRRMLRSGIIGTLSQNGVEIHSRSAFLQGLLLQEPKNIPLMFNSWQPLFQKWWKWCQMEKASPLASCFAIYHKISGVERVIVGAETAVQLREILQAYQESFDVKCYPEECNDENLVIPTNWAKLR